MGDEERVRSKNNNTTISLKGGENISKGGECHSPLNETLSVILLGVTEAPPIALFLFVTIALHMLSKFIPLTTKFCSGCGWCASQNNVHVFHKKTMQHMMQHPFYTKSVCADYTINLVCLFFKVPMSIFKPRRHRKQLLLLHVVVGF